MIRELEFVRKAVIKACYPGEQIQAYVKLHGAEFIGEFTLARLLITIDKIHGKDYHKMLFQDGQFLYIPSYEYKEAEASFKWDLTKDLAQQKPLTILSIANLLGYKNKDISCTE